MVEPTTQTASRAGWHAQHLQHGREAAGAKPSTSTRGERARILREAMRQLDDADGARQAKRNPSIVAEDTHLNTAYVNDGNGGLRALTDADGVEAVLDYGDGRIDAVKRKLKDTTFETTTIVAWVPKSLLKEIPAYYPVFNKAGTEIGRRSRWVMPDDTDGRAAVSRWFAETNKHLTTDVLTGGHDAVHGVVWNFDESTPHVHWMCDTFAPMFKAMTFDADGAAITEGGDPVVKYGKPVTRQTLIEMEADLDGVDCVRSAPEIPASSIGGIDERGRLIDYDGKLLLSAADAPVQASPHLRTEAQQMWGQSREVAEERVDPETGKTRRVQITGATKMHRYQEVYRTRMLAAGIDVEAEVNPRGTSLNKAAFGASEAERLELANAQTAVATKERDLARAGTDLDEAVQRHEAMVRETAEHEQRVDHKGAIVDQRQKELSAAWGQINTAWTSLDREREQVSADQRAAAQALAEAREALAEAQASLMRQQAAEAAQREALAEEDAVARTEAETRVATYEREQKAEVDERVAKMVDERVQSEVEQARRAGFDSGKELAESALNRQRAELKAGFDDAFAHLETMQADVVALFKSVPPDRWSPGMKVGWKVYGEAKRIWNAPAEKAAAPSDVDGSPDFA